MKAILALTLTLWLAGCGTRTGNGFVSLEFGGYDANALGFIRPDAPTVTVCFKRLRFKVDELASNGSDEEDPDNIDFTPGEITLSAGGTALGQIKLPPGTYRRVEFDLHRKCPSGKSVKVTNEKGTFTTTESAKIRFRGRFTMAESDTRLTLSADKIVRALKGVDSSKDLRERLDDIEGDF